MPAPPPRPREPLHIETELDDQVAVLGCETCGVRKPLRTSDPLFAGAVHAFFELHARCTSSIDLG